jgi:hypothetical protein
MLPLLSSTLPNDRHLHYTNILHHTPQKDTRAKKQLYLNPVSLCTPHLCHSGDGLENDHQKVGTAGGLKVSEEEVGRSCPQFVYLIDPFKDAR